MKVLVAGAGGFLGQAVVEVLAAEHSLRLFDRQHLDTPHESVVGDVADYESVRQALSGCDALVDVIMAHESTYEGAAKVAFDTNVRGMYNLLEAARGLGIRQVVHLSTGSVYSDQPPGTRFTHAMRPGARGVYALTKLLQEEICRCFAESHGMGVTVFRPWGIHDVAQGINKYGPSSSRAWSTIDRYDIARAIALALARPATSLRAYLMAGNAAAREFIEWEPLERDLGWKPERM